MTTLNDALKGKKLDTRLQEKLLREGKLSEKEYQSYLSSLDDTKEESEDLETNFSLYRRLFKNT